MREAIGGALLYYIIIPIIVILIVFMAFVMNYASTYRAANYIVTKIESCQGYDCSSMTDVKKDILSQYRYRGDVDISYESLGSNLCMAHVKLYVEFELPFIGKFNAFPVQVDTKSMHRSC